MKKERTEIPVTQLRTNTGQLAWLPSNPRQWTQTDIDRTAASIREDADFLEDRPLLVVSMPDTPDFLVFAGNLRLEGCKAAKRAKVPCVVYVPESDEDRATIKRRAMKDNGSFGSWDFDALANEWDDLPLADWGIDTPADWTAKAEDYGTDFSLNDQAKEPFRQVSFQMTDEMAQTLLLVTKAAQYTPAYQDLGEGIDDKNKNGFAIYVIAKQWAELNLEGSTSEDYKEATEKAEDLRQYLRDALAKSGRKAKDVDELLGTNGMSGHYFGSSQWMFPTYVAYMKMREILPLDRDYFECKKIEMRANFLQTLNEYEKNGKG